MGVIIEVCDHSQTWKEASFLRQQRVEFGFGFGLGSAPLKYLAKYLHVLNNLNLVGSGVDRSMGHI